MVTVNKAAKRLNVSNPTIRRWCVNGTLQARKIGPRTWDINKSSMMRMLDENVCETYKFTRDDRFEYEAGEFIESRDTMDSALDIARAVWTLWVSDQNDDIVEEFLESDPEEPTEYAQAYSTVPAEFANLDEEFIGYVGGMGVWVDQTNGVVTVAHDIARAVQFYRDTIETLMSER